MMTFCGKCGAPLDGGTSCPNCGTLVESTESKIVGTAGSHTSLKSGSWKKMVLGVAVAVTAIFMVTRFASIVDEPCDWCRNTPSRAYKMSDGSYSYVCKDCRNECVWCDNRPDRHYENAAGMMVFVCDDCYEGFMGD